MYNGVTGVPRIASRSRQDTSSSQDTAHLGKWKETSSGNPQFLGGGRKHLVLLDAFFHLAKTVGSPLPEVCSVMRWTGVLSGSGGYPGYTSYPHYMVHSCLVPGVPRIVSSSSTTLPRIMCY